MFQGHAICNLDNKSRVILPAKFRKNISPEADNKLVITRGLDSCIYVYPQDEWNKLISAIKNFNTFNTEERDFQRRFLMYVTECELDSQGRILLSPQLIEYANIKKEVVILGLLDKMEIWDPEMKKKYDDGQKLSFEEVASKVAEKVVNTNGA